MFSNIAPCIRNSGNKSNNKNYSNYMVASDIDKNVLCSKVVNARDFSCCKTPSPGEMILACKRNRHVTDSKERTNRKQQGATHSVTSMEFIHAVNSAVHLTISDPLLLLDIQGLPKCCTDIHRKRTMPSNVGISGLDRLFINAADQELWHSALLCFDMIIFAGKRPHPEDVQRILLLSLEIDHTPTLAKVFESIQMLLNNWPPCCLHTGQYYGDILGSPQMDGYKTESGMLFMMVAILSSFLNLDAEDDEPDSKQHLAAILKAIISALEADITSWRNRHQRQEAMEEFCEKPLAEIGMRNAQGQHLQVSDINYAVQVCIWGFKNTLFPKQHHKVYMALLCLVAEVFRARDIRYSEEYPRLGPSCDLLASEVALNIKYSGLESTKIGSFLSMLHPSWLSMLVGQKLLEYVHGQLSFSIIDTVTGCLLDFQEFTSKTNHCGENDEPSQDNIAKRTAKIVNKRNHTGEVQLHRSCRSGNVMVVRKILKIPGVKVNIADNTGWTPLHEAVNHSQVECVKALLNFMPSPGMPYVCTNARAECGTTPLIIAAIAGNTEICHLLLQHSGTALLEDVLEGCDVKKQWKQCIPERMQSFLKMAKLNYQSVTTSHIGVSLSHGTWELLYPLLVHLVCSQMATYHVPLVRRQFTLKVKTPQDSIAYVNYSTLRKIKRILQSYEKMKNTLKYLFKGPLQRNPAVKYFRSYL